MKKILVVEDEEIVRSNISELLEAEGHDIMQACNGAEALEKLKKFIPDLIISDIMMPIVDGYELVKRVQDNPLLSAIPIILLTARVEVQDQRKGMQIGADDYITKPFRSQDLLDAVETRLKKQAVYNQKFEDLKSHVATYIPHELRTPLVSILGFADLIISSIDDLSKDEILEMAEKVKNSGIRLYDRIEKFLFYSDLELLKTAKHEQKQCDVGEKYIHEKISSKFQNKDTSRIKYEITDASVAISEEYLMRALYELIDNSFKFSDNDTDISLKGFIEEDKYNFEILDFGIGMKNTDIQQIGALKQFNRDEHQQHGTGLGLAIVKNIMEIAGTELKIESVLAEYTKVTFQFDLIQ